MNQTKMLRSAVVALLGVLQGSSACLAIANDDDRAGQRVVIADEDSKTPPLRTNESGKIDTDVPNVKPAPLAIAGRVVLRSDPQHGVPQARVRGVAVQIPSGGILSTVSDAKGNFEVKRSPCDMIIHAITKDNLLSRIVRVAAGDTKAIIAVGPTAAAHGRLIDESTGRPLIDRQIDFGVRVTHGDGTWSLHFGGSTRTNAKGEFTLTGLTSNWTFELKSLMETGPCGASALGWSSGEVIATSPGTVELGDVTPRDPYGPKELTAQIVRAMDSERPLQTQLKTKLHDARLGDQRVLIFAASPKSAVCRRFFSIYFLYSYNAEPQMTDKAEEALSNYVILPVDTSEERLRTVRSLLERLKVPIPSAGDATIAIVDLDGRVIAVTDRIQLWEQQTLSARRLIGFLEPHAPLMPDAEKLLADALAQAKREDKRVLVRETGPRCGPCVRLSRYLDEQKMLLKKDYVCVKLDRRFVNGERVIDRVRKKSDGSIPWMVILDASGKPLISSDGPNGNFGFPQKVGGVTHFQKMLRTTARRLNDGEIRSLISALAQTKP